MPHFHIFILVPIFCIDGSGGRLNQETKANGERPWTLRITVQIGLCLLRSPVLGGLVETAWAGTTSTSIASSSQSRCTGAGTSTDDAVGLAETGTITGAVFSIYTSAGVRGPTSSGSKTRVSCAGAAGASGVPTGATSSSPSMSGTANFFDCSSSACTVSS